MYCSVRRAELKARSVICNQIRKKRFMALFADKAGAAQNDALSAPPALARDDVSTGRRGS